MAPEPAGWSRALREQVWAQERVQRVRLLHGLRVQLWVEQGAWQVLEPEREEQQEPVAGA